MLRFKPIVWLASIFLCLAALFPGAAPARAQEPSPVPPGFRQIDSARGVQLFRKDYRNGSPDYVQVVNLGHGAAVEVLHGQIKEPRDGRGVYGGDDPRMTSRSLESYWAEIKQRFRAPFCVTNGQFFYMPEYPTRLPFPLKKDGVIISDGYGKNQYPNQKLMLEIWPDRLDISPLTAEALQSSTAPDIIAGLTEEANKRAKQKVGRTFVGIDDLNSDGAFEILLVFNTSTAKQSDAAEVLRDFGADKVMMLDGGGSTQLQCGNKAYIASDRAIPQAIAILAAPDSGIPRMTAVASSPKEAAATPQPQAQAGAAAAGGGATPDADRAVAMADLKTAVAGAITAAAPEAGTMASGPTPESALANASLAGLKTAPETADAAPGAGEQLDLAGVLLVPISMLPVVTLLFFAVNKMQRRY